ncbi:hypothetical protein ACH5RR_015493 [Cinchona calisaya]|uniref:Uncharacterized protein n=1 Tax=Cinchona calisaya TaxID=153742 RepID=A0ABD2ZTD1_9GENT
MQSKAKKDQSVVIRNPSPNSVTLYSLHSDKPNPNPSLDAHCLLLSPSLLNPTPSRDRKGLSGLGNLEKQVVPSYKQIQDDSTKVIQALSVIKLNPNSSPTDFALGSKADQILEFSDAIVSQLAMICSSSLNLAVQEIDFSPALVLVSNENVQCSISSVDIEVISNSILTKLHSQIMDDQVFHKCMTRTKKQAHSSDIPSFDSLSNSEKGEPTLHDFQHHIESYRDFNLQMDKRLDSDDHSLTSSNDNKNYSH